MLEQPSLSLSFAPIALLFSLASCGERAAPIEPRIAAPPRATVTAALAPPSSPAPPSASSSSASSSSRPKDEEPKLRLPFRPSNLPADMEARIEGDMVFPRPADISKQTRCQMSTDTGEVRCFGKDGDLARFSFTYRQMAQVDARGEFVPDHAAGVFITRNFVVPAGVNLRVIGRRPLILLAERVGISGSLIVSSHRAIPRERSLRSGVLADPPPAILPGNDGGSYCGAGGQGASSKATTVPLAPLTAPPALAPLTAPPALAPLTAPPALAPVGDPALTPLLGGAPGGSSSTGGAGAVQISAAEIIEINGLIVAGGAGGASPDVGRDAGGGGDSGGSVLLEAPRVRVEGTIAVNGGSGAGGLSDDEVRRINALEKAGYNGSISMETWKSSQDAILEGRFGEVGGRGEAQARGGRGGGGKGSGGLIVDGEKARGVRAGGGGSAGRIRINTSGGAADIGRAAVLSPTLATACATQGRLDLSPSGGR
jgi:hypothetical protein